ncbi:MAG TPA: DUF998 domain-containing protein [Paracoccaceae bacterium]|nr:DUF998 domain-containing protein [Paracoccaceae bacterium]
MEKQPLQDVPTISNYALREAVGWIGMLLPFVLWIGGALLGEPSPNSSISYYYYSGMGDLFVGSLCVLGVFFLVYRGYGTEGHPLFNDLYVAKITGVSVLLVALVPTGRKPEEVWLCDETVHGRILCWAEKYLGSLQQTVHLFSAILFLTCLAVFCLYLFPKSDQARSEFSPKKRIRKQLYRAMGWVILGSMALAGLSIAFEDKVPTYAVFVFESFAVIAFGVAWFVKSQRLGVLYESGERRRWE